MEGKMGWEGKERGRRREWEGGGGKGRGGERRVYYLSELKILATALTCPKNMVGMLDVFSLTVVLNLKLNDVHKAFVIKPHSHVCTLETSVPVSCIIDFIEFNSLCRVVIL